MPSKDDLRGHDPAAEENLEAVDAPAEDTPPDAERPAPVKKKN